MVLLEDLNARTKERYSCYCLPQLIKELNIERVNYSKQLERKYGIINKTKKYFYGISQILIRKRVINITTNLDNVYDYSDTIQNYWRNQSGNTAILPNITSFKAVPDEEDKTLIHLTWMQLLLKLSHYEIRCSKDWKLDARLGNIPNNQVVTDDLTETI